MSIERMPVDRCSCGLNEKWCDGGCHKNDVVFNPIPVRLGEWQLCPKCNGQGTVSKPPYLSGDVFEWTSAETQWTCDVCNGAKILARPVI